MQALSARNAQRLGLSAPKRSVRACVSSARATAVAPAALSQEQVEQFREQGYLVLPGHASKEECVKLKQRVEQLLDHFDPAAYRSIFSTRNQATTTDQYFLDSASAINYFFEEKAFDESGKLRQDKALSINKIGHALHDLDPVFRSFSRSPRVAAVLKSLGYQRPLPVQSMYIFKQPHIGGEVVPHQDSSFVYTSPQSCVGLWWALEDATRTNGCLWAMPGVHKQGLKRRFIVKEGGGIGFDAPQPAWDLSKFEPLECEAGTLVLLHGENVHYSCENASPVSRHSYSMHLVESTPGYEWAKDNWAQRRPDMPWEPLYG